MFDHIMRLLAAGAKIYRVHSDSITYTLPTDAPVNLPVGPAVLQFKHEYSGNIESFAAVGVNSISVVHRDINGDAEVSFKLGGFRQRRETLGSLNHESIVRMIDATIKREAAAANGKITLEKEATQIKLQNICSSNKGPLSSKVRRNYTLEVSSALKRRQLIEPIEFPYQTYPYGYLSTNEAKHRCHNPYLNN